MGKGSTKGQVKHFTTMPDGTIGCFSLGCGKKATMWVDMERYGIRRWLSTACCDDCGERNAIDPHHTMRTRRIT
ncbi:hypothetical protein [Nocardia sp. BMG111209]|uniref:hypothetical protein n=1 Tax=Nocardia sp. BMG111209 TaxID=1160137 RepID=UPI0012DDF1F1|nr:hypothetical protein [Nocardia sp. BMG111209]